MNIFPQKYFLLLSGLLLASTMFESCTKSGSTIDPEAHKKEIESWRQKRHTRLLNDQGWLTLCGLFWLKEGENTMGTDSSNAIVFPSGKSPAVAGSLFLEKDSIRFVASTPPEIKFKDSIVTSMRVHHDGEPNAEPTILSVRSLTLQIIKRGAQYGVRVKDKQNPALLNFKGMDYFPIDPGWRFEAKFEPYTPSKSIEIATVINTIEKDSCPGAIVFEKDGKEYRLDAVKEVGSDDQLFIMLSDETSGKETYGLGRQLYTELPKDNKVVIDFNKAYNWPCVFTNFATCPIPPRQNHLPFRVEAGEKMYKGHE